jgi:hypothetical protein
MSPTVPPSWITRQRHIIAALGKEAHLDNTEIRFFARIVNRNLRDAFYPVLNCIGDVRDDLRPFRIV